MSHAEAARNQSSARCADAGESGLSNGERGAAGDDPHPGARRTIDDESNTIFVSAASAWEITTRHRIGKLAQAEAVALDVSGTIAGQGFEELAITVDDAARAGRLPGLHRDPFDRVLIAQALAGDLTVVSADKVFDGYGVRRLW